MSEQDMRDALAAEGIDTTGLDYAAVAQLYAQTFGDAPADDTPIIPLDVLKRHLKVEHDEDDALIEGYLQAAIGWLDGPTGYLWRSVLPTERVLDLPALSYSHRLPLPPVISVIAVETWDGTAYVAQDASIWQQDGGRVTLRPGKAWGASGVSRIRYLAGYENIGEATQGDAARIRTALMLKVQSLYERPERDVYASAAVNVLDGLRLAA